MGELRKNFDDRFEYPNNWGGSAVCHLEVWKHEDEHILLATEIDENEGTSVTNAIERLVTLAIKQFGIDPNKMTVIEHYPDHNHGPIYESMLDEHWSLVTFDEIRSEEYRLPRWTEIVRKPRWIHISPTDEMLARLQDRRQWKVSEAKERWLERQARA